ncbi:CDP-diacylglycerol--glycerol-3-phosphate 3-phosphatidyltransferase [Acetobacteraceae bacterium]|nr:CDP-diacylglycerol--glycerol-3-phosphate 3-phosphatidyltransferase [Acetobacteraceae bacterium]
MCSYTMLPNFLTLLRVASIPVIVLLLALKSPLWSVICCGIFILSCVTDYVDGALARRQKVQSELGRIMDPIADKLLVGCLLLALAGLGHLEDYATLYAGILILFREIMVGGLRDYASAVGSKIPTIRIAKWKTAVQMTGLGFLIVGMDGGKWLGLPQVPVTLIGAVLIWIAVIPTWISGFIYLRYAVQIFRQQGAKS